MIVSEFQKIIGFELMVTIIYDSNESKATCSFLDHQVDIPNKWPLYKTFKGIRKRYSVNSVTFTNKIAKSLEPIIKISMKSFMILPIPNAHDRSPKKVVVLVNKTSDTDEKSPKFTKKDELISDIFGLFLSSLTAYNEVGHKYRARSTMATKFVGWVEELNDCESIGQLMNTMENHCKEITKAERTNILFYDHKRNELYKRIKKGNKEGVKSNFP